jgi:hypothetical protein
LTVKIRLNENLAFSSRKNEAGSKSIFLAASWILDHKIDQWFAFQGPFRGTEIKKHDKLRKMTVICDTCKRIAARKECSAASLQMGYGRYVA